MVGKVQTKGRKESEGSDKVRGGGRSAVSVKIEVALTSNKIEFGSSTRNNLKQAFVPSLGPREF